MSSFRLSEGENSSEFFKIVKEHEAPNTCCSFEERSTLPSLAEVFVSDEAGRCRSCQHVSDILLRKLTYDATVARYSLTDKAPKLTDAILLDELARHPGSPHVGHEPVPAAVRREVVLHAVGVRIMQTCPSGKNGKYGMLPMISMTPLRTMKYIWL